MLKIVSCAMSEAAVWRLGARRFATASGAVAERIDKPDPAVAPSPVSTESSDADLAQNNKNTGLVAAAFASLNAPETEEVAPAAARKPSPKSFKVNRFQQIDVKITTAGDINSLLSIAENPVISRRHALRIVSVLSEWSSSNKVKLEQFERDARFLKLCRILARSRDSAAVSSLSHADDLGTVLSVTGDDEAARLVADLTLPQMIKVMSALVARGRRSTPLLRSLAHHITQQPDTLDVKRAADLLFSMTTLSFPDPPLMERVCNDVVASLPRTERIAGVSSVLVSLGLLRYRSPPALDTLCDWLAEHAQLVRPQDLQSALQTYATLAYPANSLPKLIEMALQLREEDLPKAVMWLDLVFSLLLLEQVTSEHLQSALSPAFIDKLYTAGELPMSTRRKLQLLDAYCARIHAGTPRGPLPEEVSAGPAPAYSKDKQLYVQSVIDTLRSLISSDNFLKLQCRSGAGFLFDGEFAVDSKCHPVPLNKAARDDKVLRIALMGLDYHDFCRKSLQPLGVNLLYKRLLELEGYRVLLVPFTEYNPRDKLVSRVQYLERRLKDLVAST